jgi:RNAse (barnase) inhibitor barstar
VAQITLDGSSMNGQEEFYWQFFAQAVSVMPDYGGRSLDALHDDLRDLAEPLTIVWECSEDARNSLGRWFEEVLSVLRERDESDQPVTVVLR